MRKYRLELNDLEIESFGTTPEVQPRVGTVYGHATEFTNCTCDYNACTGAYYTCDAHCGTANSADVNNTCDLACGGGTGGNSDQTACLNCFTNADTCTMVDGCVQTRQDTCYPC